MNDKINLVLRQSSLNNLSVCPRLYYFRNTLTFGPVQKEKYFSEGEFVHSLLEEYYKDILNRRKQDLSFYENMALSKAADNDDLELDESRFMIDLFMSYLRNYSNEEDWIIEGVEEPFAVLLYEDDNCRIIFRGKSDLLIKTRQGVPVVVDHKVVSQNRLISGRQNQGLGYCHAFNRKDFIVNSIGKQKDESKRFKRVYINYDKYQIEEWKENTILKGLEVISYHQSGIFPVNYTGCNFHGKLCTFHAVCDTTRDNWEYKLNSAYRQVEDYDPMGDE